MAPDAQHAAFLRTKYFGALDGLRAISIGAVIAHHAGVGWIFGPGLLGVSLFFTISGYVVTTILLRERRRTGTIALQRFHTRRVLRIWPLYFAVLLGYVALVGLGERDLAARANFFHHLPSYLTFTSNCLVDRAPGQRVIFYFAWSLATQEQLYLLWPSILRFSRSRLVPVALTALLVVANVALDAAAVAGAVPGDAIPVRLLTSDLVQLCLGCLAALALDHPAGHRLARRVAGGPWSVPAGAAAVVALLSIHGLPRVVPSLAIAYLVVAVVVRPSRWVRALVENGPIRYVGTVTYGMYLTHMLAINAARRVLPGASTVWTALLAYPLAVLLASATHRLLERPFLALRERLAPPTRAPQAAPADDAQDAPLALASERRA